MGPVRGVSVAALASAAMFLAFAAPAVAAPCGEDPYATCVPLSFNNGVLDLSGQPDNVVISPSTAPLVATAKVTMTSASEADIAIDPADFDFPTHSFSEPVPGTIDAILNSSASGHVNFGNGQVTIVADMEAQVTLQGFGSCNVDTGPLSLSTDNTEPLPGQRFPAGPAGPVSGAGAITVPWTGLPAGTGAGCPLVNNLINGPGGLWLSRNIAPNLGDDPDPVTPAKLGLVVSPRKAKVDAGEPAKLTARVSNSGQAAAGGVKVCAKAEKPLKPKPKCREIGTLAGGATVRAKFKVKTDADEPGKYKLRFTATGTGLAAITARAKVKARG